MATLLSAKDVLVKYDITSPRRNPDSKTGKYAAHEFQDYAYKLAKDLRDLDNLKIYMKLAKTVERSLLERCFSYVADVNTEEKGRLFLWKLKKLREEILKRRTKSDFSYEVVTKYNSKFRDVLAKKLVSENNYKIATLISPLIISNKFLKSSPKILLINPSSDLLVELLIEHGFNVYCLDSSKTIISNLKTSFPKQKRKFITKKFLSNSYKLNQFDLIFINRLFNSSPLSSHKEIVKNLRQILKQNSKILVLNKSKGAEDTEFWNEKIIKDLEYLFCSVERSQKSLKSLFQDNLFKSQTSHQVSKIETLFEFR